MSKRLMLSLVLVAVALLIPSSGFAGKPAAGAKYCSYICQSCGGGKVQTCSWCDNDTQWHCGSCYTGPICMV